MGDDAVRVCFVCLGNICRSPTAEGVMRSLVAEAGAEGRVEVDSAGTGAWHVGERPDDRARAEARRRGLELTSRARQFAAVDFEVFDLVVAMDRSNRADLHDLAPDAAARAKVVLLRDYEPGDGDDREVPDPYHGGPEGFARMFDLIDASCRGLLAELLREQAPPAHRAGR